MMRLGATCRASCCSQLEFEACCGENQPLRLFVDVAHQQLLRARSKRLRANLHFPRKLIAVWNTSPVPFFFNFFLIFPPPNPPLPHPAFTCLRLLWLSLMTMPELLRGLCLTLSFTGLTYVWTLCEWKGNIVVCIYFLATFFCCKLASVSFTPPWVGSHVWAAVNWYSVFLFSPPYDTCSCILC